MLKIPNPEDKESRVIRSGFDKSKLTVAFTIGPNEYPGFEPKSFFPTKEQIELAGQSVLGMAKESQLGISQVVFESWQDTTFILRKKGAPEPVPPVPDEALREIGSNLVQPRIKIVLSPQKREGISSLKEQGLSSENRNFQEVALKISNRMTEILEPREPVAAEVEFAESADTDVSVEFDCGVESSKIIPEEVRKYMAESFLRVLDSNRTTKNGSGEVWIRQGKPERMVFDNK